MLLLLLYLNLLSSSLILFGNHLGILGLKLINTIISSLLLIISSLISYEILYKGLILDINLFTWFYSDILDCKISFLLDKVSCLILYLIIIIYTIVLHYSYWYMKDESHQIRFIGYLNLFCFMMMILVLSNNLIISFIGWEGVGITSFLLINFWFTRIQANKSAFKAMLYNRFGDIFFLYSLFFILNLYHLFQFNQDFLFFFNLNSIIVIGFFIASIIKSAQIPLYGWLGDAMEGPTPVSALLHAATMVTAGIFLTYRILPTFILNPTIYTILGYFGIITIIVAGLIGLYQNDIKRVIAYSTSSQIGYMLYSSFLGLYNLSYFHLIIHGFFKALLFLSAGIIIHSYNNQDLRRFGGLIFNYPLTYLYFIIGTLSITSFPFFSGYFSKDSIIEYTWFSNFEFYIFSLLGVILTVSYSIRLIYLIFYIKPNLIIRGSDYFNPYLIILLFGSLFLGYLLNHFFFNLNISILPFYTQDIHYIDKIILFLPLILSILGILIGYLINKLIIYLSLTTYIKYYIPIYTIFNKRFFIDQIIYRFVYSFLLKPSYTLFFKLIDRGILELWGSLGIYRTFFPSFTKLKPLNLNYLIKLTNYNLNFFSDYISYLFISLLLLIIIFIILG